MASPGSGEAWRVFCLSQALKVGKIQLGSVAAWDSDRIQRVGMPGPRQGGTRKRMGRHRGWHGGEGGFWGALAQSWPSSELTTQYRDP